MDLVNVYKIIVAYKYGYFEYDFWIFFYVPIMCSLSRYFRGFKMYLGGSHVNSNYRAPYVNLEITPRAPYVKFKNIGLVLRSQESIGLENFSYLIVLRSLVS